VVRAGLGRGLAVTDYAGTPQALVHAFKVNGSRFLARVLAAPMVDQLAEWCENAKLARVELVLVPAPSRPAANRRRGYIPAQMLSKEVARRARGLGFRVRVVKALRVSNLVKDQSLLNAAERKRNLEGRMRVVPGARQVIGEAKVILVDDIITTGSTLASMRSALVSEGIQPEIFLTFAETL